MVEIKLNEKIHKDGRGKYGKGRARVFVDPDKVVFEDGLALVEAKIVSESTWGKYCNRGKIADEVIETSGLCYGVINEKFEEAFPGKNEAQQYLMFFEENTCVTKVDKNNYLVTRVNVNYSTYHVRMNDNQPSVFDVFEAAKPTQLNDVFIMKRRIGRKWHLYDVPRAEPLSRNYLAIQCVEKNANQFLVIDELYSPDYRGTLENSDIFTFKIDTNDEIVSPILSDKLGDYYIKDIPTVKYDVIKQAREEDLNLMSKREEKKRVKEKLREKKMTASKNEATSRIRKEIIEY